MKIETGLFDHMVLQRNRDNVSEAAFAGTTGSGGELFVTVKAAGKALPKLRDARLATVSRGRFSGCLKGIPAGGPYEIELSIRDQAGKTVEHVVVRDVLVGDVWLLGGQSNMQGVGRTADGPKAHPLARAFYMDDTWRPARDPIHNLPDAVDQVHTDLCGGTRPGINREWSAGPGVAFGQSMHELSGVPQGLLACGHGGTSMTQWDPKLKKLGGRSLYGAMLRRLRKNGGRVAGLVWYQGCSDANPDAAPLFSKRMKAFVAAVRRDCNAPKLPVVMVQISRVVGWGEGNDIYWNSVQEQQRKLGETIPFCLTVPAIDLSLDDQIHISGAGQTRLGRRLAQAMFVLQKGRAAGKPPITVGKVSVKPDARGSGEIHVRFDNVTGALRAGDRPAGFALSAGPGVQAFDTKLAGDTVVLRTGVPVAQASSAMVHYGRGTDPYCNITDAADRSLPVFGPLPLGRPRAVSAFVRNLQISALRPSAGKLERLETLPDLSTLQLEARAFTQDFCSRHPELEARAPEDVLVYFVCNLECSEAMKLGVLFGYDGPLRLWIDGKPAFFDPKGTNPALADAKKVRFAAAPGRHQLVFAMGSNHGVAWGVFLRFERFDIPVARLRLGPAAYAMPKILC